ncbi:hypothetical protein DOY81_008880 [Sarcophaga bullata]|nr:hypothetical protein DOY81_008880 [Sarcophaga bullata]
MPQENEGVAKETCDKEQQFTVEKIVSRRVRKGRVEYLTKWQGFEEPGKYTGNRQESITSTEDTKTADNDSKALKSSSATWQLNGTKFVSDFLTRQPAPKTGFEKGLLPEEILGAAEFKGNLYLVIKFRGDDEPHMVHNEVANKKIPQMVIEFYEKSLFWQPTDN